MIKYIPIDQIVHTISITHKFNKEKLYAINTSDVLEGEILNAPLMNVSELKGQFKKTIENGDLLFSEIRPANRRYAKVRIEDTRDYVVSTKLMVLRKYNNDVDFDYFYYCLTNQWFLNILQKRAENRICSFPQITFELLSEYKFRIPELDEQKKIANILLLLDKKISLNTRMNAELETMAKQLYDYWFVQFDFPNENGKPYKSSGGKMVYNEKLKREIPEGWDVKRIGDVVEIKSGYPFKSELMGENGHYKIITIRNVQDNHLDISDVSYTDILPENIKQYCILSEGDILISLTGNVGRVCIVYQNGLLLNQRVGVIKPKNYHTQWCHQLFLDKKVRLMIENWANGCAQANVSPIDIENLIIVKPSDNLLDDFEKLLKPVASKQIANCKNVNYLTHLRDSLLPMLMNGQVTVE